MDCQRRNKIDKQHCKGVALTPSCLVVCRTKSVGFHNDDLRGPCGNAAGLLSRRLSALQAGGAVPAHYRSISVSPIAVGAILPSPPDTANRHPLCSSVRRMASPASIGSNGEYILPNDYGYSAICFRRGRHREGSENAKAAGAKTCSARLYGGRVFGDSFSNGSNNGNNLRHTDERLVARPTLCRVGSRSTDNGPTVPRVTRRSARPERTVQSGGRPEGQRGRLVSVVARDYRSGTANLRHAANPSLSVPPDTQWSSATVSHDYETIGHLRSKGGWNGLPSLASFHGFVHCGGRRRCHQKTLPLIAKDYGKVYRPSGGASEPKRGPSSRPNSKISPSRRGPICQAATPSDVGLRHSAAVMGFSSNLRGGGQ